MKQDKTQYIGHHGVVLMLHRFTVTPTDRCHLQHLRLSERGDLEYEINDLLVSLYDRMQARNLPCEMLVAVSRPLLREQADLFNKQRISIASVAGSAVASAAKPFGLLGIAAGPGMSWLVYNHLETRHAGDVVVIADARVKGGIGPQSSVSSLLIKAKGGGHN